jgi:hypothetical protein
MCSGRGTRALPRVGFPIRKSWDQRLVSTYPRLIAAAHVLHRLLVPRHPPCALILLTGRTYVDVAMEFSRCAGAKPIQRTPPRGRSLKTQQRGYDEVDVILGELRHRTRQASSTSSTPTGSNCSGFPRKEVIQPQLPLRLPCYDFVPITSPTFDGSLPCGLGHRLRVLPAFMT